ncbi:MAG TPA: BspA family leucine-rich repeat surface protein [Flavobacterium sp.]|nr:BspA family leucine-rich repeat surface protein [Flavobacterium sp.]
MKKIYLLFVFFFLSNLSNAQNPDALIMTFEVVPESLNIVIKFPIVSTANNYTIDFGDGTILTNQTDDTAIHTYNTAGIYTVTITGVYPCMHLSYSIGDQYTTNYKIRTIEQWGTNQWINFEYTFYNCSNLTINAIDAPDLTQITSLMGLFRDCDYLVTNGNLNNWNVSSVTNMREMFLGTPFYDSQLNNWDVSNVTDMSMMFGDSDLFNQPLNNWNVSSVTNMNDMFGRASSFNQPLNNWDVSNVSNMEYMFSNASSFNQPLNNWNVESVTNMDYMFYYASVFDQPLNNWNVSNVTTMREMFHHTTAFNQPLDNWDVSNVTRMDKMFSYSVFNESIHNWNLTNVTNITNIFQNAIDFNQPINNWDVSNITNMSGMFSGASSFNQPLNNWDVSNVTKMNSMFNGASSFNQPLDNWDVSNVTNMGGMFRQASSFNQNLNNWNTANVTSLKNMFYGASSFNQPLNNWNVSNVLNMTWMFLNAHNFNQNLSSWEFNSNISFYSGIDNNFVSFTSLSIDNYDLLLMRFAELELSGRVFSATLTYCNSNVRDYLINDLGWEFLFDNLSENCDYNSVYGKILFDENNDGCNINDVKTGLFFITANNGTPYYSTLSNNGEYILNLFEDNYIIGLPNLPNYYTAVPESYSVNFTGFGNYEELNFCLTSNQMIEDLNIVILPITEARPGFETEYQLVLQNIGTQTINDIFVSLTFDNTLQTFVNALPSTTSITTNQLNFELESLSPTSSTVINFTMLTLAPPNVNGGEILNFTATVTPNTNDYTPSDNTFELNQIVVNSFDPNDKQVLQGEEIHIDEVNNYLHYLIRFQNTGTASAITVRIKDELHETLDYNTIQIVSASHNYQVKILNGNQIEFIFDRILLPHQGADEAGSNGFIAYKIKAVENTQVGDIIIGNQAEIYFDYNLPIITNSVATEVVNPTSGITTNLKDFISVYPNPTSSLLNIKTKSNVELKEIKIYNLQGRELLYSKQNLETISIEDLSSGIYLLHIKTNEGTLVQRVIRK